MTDVPHEYLDLVRDYRQESKRQKRTNNQNLPSRQSSPKKSPQIPRVERPKESPAQSIPRTVESQESNNESESDSEEEWENVDIEEGLDSTEEPANDLTVSFQAKPSGQRQTRNLPPRELRIEMHLIGILSWVFWGSLSSQRLRAYRQKFKNWLPLAIEQEIHPPPHLTTFLRSKKLRDGLRHAGAVWINRQGTDILNEQCEMRWCAMLRSQGLDARLIVSIQPPLLNSAGTTAKRAVGHQPPIIWAEVWDPWAKVWITADPVTSTFEHITTKSNLEPALSDKGNVMRYVLAFDKHGFVRDVTRRYSSQYNARTRKKRIDHESIPLQNWYNRLLGLFSKNTFDERDIAELSELQRRILREGMPRRVQDFVGHPVYVLEANLHKNQVLRPDAQSCGRVAMKAGPSVPVYRREDVLTCLSSMQWFRRGRQVRVGVAPRMHRSPTPDEETVGLYSEDQTEIYVPPPVEADGTVPKSQYRTVDIFAPTMIPRGGVHLKLHRARDAAKLIRVDYANAVTRLDWSRRGPKSHYDGIVVAQQYEPAVTAVCEGLASLEAEEAEAREEMRLLLLWRKFIIGIQIWERIERMNPEPDADIAEIDRWKEDSYDESSPPNAVQNDFSDEGWEPTGSESDEQAGGFFEEDKPPSENFWEPQPSESESEGSGNAAEDPGVKEQGVTLDKHKSPSNVSSPHEEKPQQVAESVPLSSFSPKSTGSGASVIQTNNTDSDSGSDFPEIIMDEMSESEL